MIKIIPVARFALANNSTNRTYKKMKNIGIPGWRMEDKYFGLPISYINYFSQFGTVRIITPQDLEPVELDLLVLPGGLDINPISYGEIPGYRTQNPNIFLEHFDEKILPKYLENDTPIFAICRGFQKLWTLFGGLLEQDIPWHEKSRSHTDQIHPLCFTENYKELRHKIDKVTSRHHQGCIVTEGIPLDVMATAGLDDRNKIVNISYLVEMFIHQTKNIIGVQYHPEDHDGSDQLTPYLIRNLLEKKNN